MFVHGVWGRNHGKLLNLAPSAIASHKKQVDSQSSKHKMIECPLVEGVNKSGVVTGVAKHPSTF